MKRTAKLADVAKAAGVSQGTVSHVFNKPGLVRAELREKVEAAARLLGYSGPDPRGRMLRAGKVNAIGVVVMDSMAYTFTDPFSRLFMEGIAEVCDEQGAGLALVSAMNDETAAWNIETALVDGFIVHCLERGANLVKLARKRNLPFVGVDVDTRPGESAVLVDDREGAAVAARHLLDLGHRRIGILSLEVAGDGRTGPVDAARLQVRDGSYKTTRDRLEGYADALREFGIDLTSLPIVETLNYRDKAWAAMEQLHALAPDLTAVLAMSDTAALTVLDWARQKGIAVPGRLSVIGFDDVPEAALADPPLTTMAQPIKLRGRVSAEIILGLKEPRIEIMKVTLVPRGSTGPARAG